MKPCPFCGSKNIVAGHISAMTLGVYCIDCSAKGPHIFLPDEFPREDMTLEELREELIAEGIEKWNKRHE